MHFCKYHGLGNDYLVIQASEVGESLTAEQIRLICHRNYGIGSDGILLGPSETAEAEFGLRIFNPDGSEAEKSGNGLRIFARYLWDRQLVGAEPFTIKTAGGKVKAQVHAGGRSVTVDMGRVSFDSNRIPVLGPSRQVMNEVINANGRDYSFCAATVGNPHCVILRDEVSADEAKHIGPLVETDHRFPNRINVQFMQVIDRANIRIEIWERGAGYTLASGSSSCAAAAVAHRLGLCDADINVHMPGGRINVSIAEDFSLVMTGPVARIAEGLVFEEALPEPEKADSSLRSE